MRPERLRETRTGSGKKVIEVLHGPDYTLQNAFPRRGDSPWARFYRLHRKEIADPYVKALKDDQMKEYT